MTMVLLVDDDPLQAYVRRSVLLRHFRNVERATDAAEAFIMVEDPQFALTNRRTTRADRRGTKAETTFSFPEGVSCATHAQLELPTAAPHLPPSRHGAERSREQQPTDRQVFAARSNLLVSFGAQAALAEESSHG